MFESKDNTYTVTASKRECISEPELKRDNSIDILICVRMKPAPFYKRMARAVKHVFGYRSCYGDFDSFEFTFDAAAPLKRLIDIVKKTENKTDKYAFHQPHTIELAKGDSGVEVSFSTAERTRAGHGVN